MGVVLNILMFPEFLLTEFSFVGVVLNIFVVSVLIGGGMSNKK